MSSPRSKVNGGLTHRFALSCCTKPVRMGFGFSALCRHWASRDTFAIRRAFQLSATRAEPRPTGLTRSAWSNALLAWLSGERGRMRVIHVPSAEEEAQRHLVRDRGQMQKEVLQHRDRIRKLLRTVGCWQSIDGDIGKRLAQEQLRCHDGSALPEQLRHRLSRECERLALAEQQFATLEKNLIEQLPPVLQERVAHLRKLKAIGPVGAVRMVLELFWREFDNRRQVGACVGLVPQPYDSGDSRVDQGISKQGNRKVRSLSIELAWLWLRYQPNSAITKWYLRRVHGNEKNKRGKRIAIVAVARRLVIALWRFLAQGEVPQGAVLKKDKGTALSAA